MAKKETAKLPWTVKTAIQNELPCLFRKHHLNRDITIGFVGDRGAGKSIGGGLVALLDYMAEGEPCFSNVSLKATLSIDDELAEEEYGIKGGSATFEAEPLDKYKFLRFDEEYRGGVFFTHEFNIWLADARRSTSNLNLETDDVVQELRKLESAWIYDCTHEMFVDMRVRDATDLFIKTSDTALTQQGMANKRPQGLEFEWWVHPMTQKGAAIMGLDKPSVGFTNPLGPYYVRGKQLWGLIDTKKRELRERYKSQRGVTGDVTMTESPEMIAAKNKWRWLEEKAIAIGNKCRHNSRESIQNWELTSEIGRPLTREIRGALRMFGISFDSTLQEYRVNIGKSVCDSVPV